MFISKRDLYNFFGTVFSRRITTLCASITYYFIIAIIPFVVLFFGISAFFGFDVISIFGLENSQLPPQIIDALRNQYVVPMDFKSFGAIFIFCFVFYLASGFFGHLISVGKFLYDDEITASNLKYKKFLQRPISILMLIWFVIMLMLELYISVLLSNKVFELQLFEKGIGLFFAKVISMLVGLIFFTLVINIINVVISPTPLGFKENLTGSITTYLIWMVTSYLFLQYSGNGATTQVFGDFAPYVMVIYWAFILAFGFICGVILNRYLYLKRKGKYTKDGYPVKGDINLIAMHFEQNIQ